MWPFDVLSSIIKYCLVIVTSYSFIDASTEGYEEEDIYEEEGDHFDHQPNQGKLTSMQTMLVQASKDTCTIYLLRISYLLQVFISQVLLYYLSKYFYS